MTSPDDLHRVLEQSFGLPSFREGQEEIISAIVEGRDVIAVMPTGGGKSLCYQLPALLLPGLTIVVSPLIALMKDQVDALQARRLPATFINSTLKPEEQNRRLRLSSEGQIKLLYVAPERFRSRQFTRTIAGLDVSLFAVDEAHCLSQWGHDFRPDYLKLGDGIAAVGRPPIAAFTATATQDVRNDIAASLKLDDPLTFFAGIDRDNLFLDFEFPLGRGTKEQKLRFVTSTVARNHTQTGIVYAATRKNVEKVADRLRAEGFRVLAYHAGLDDDTRAYAQELFMNGELQVIVATNAFGMGVDKADIRYVIHFDFPGSVEAYYQEVGRAGRDGKPARCLTLFAEGDRFVQEFFHEGSNPKRELIEKVHRILCEEGTATVELTVAQIAARSAERPNEMAVSTCLKVLERFGVISRGYRGQARGYFHLLMPLKKIELALAKAKVQRAVVRALPAVALGDPSMGAEVDIAALAYEAQMEREKVGRVLLELHRSGFIDYEPPFRGRATHVLIRDAELPVDWGMLEEKARRDHAKIDMMVSFSRTRACRKWFLRRYFVGEGGKCWCGACERCRLMTPDEAEAVADREERRVFKSSRRSRRRANGTSKSGSPARAQSSSDPPTEAMGTQENSVGSPADPGGEAGRHAAPSGTRTDVKDTHLAPLPNGDSYDSSTPSRGSRSEDKERARHDSTGAGGLEGDALNLVRKVLSCVARMRGRFGRTRVAQVLKGSKEKEILRRNLDSLSTYGLLADMSIDDILSVIDALLVGGLLRSEQVGEVRSHRMAVVLLTDAGREVMRGNAPAYITLPSGLLANARQEPAAKQGSSARSGSSSQRSDSPNRPGADTLGDGSRHLYRALCEWRREQAYQKNVPPYVIFNNRTVEELARVRPQSHEALLAVKGMGPKRCATYGEEILAIVLEHSRLNTSD